MTSPHAPVRTPRLSIHGLVSYCPRDDVRCPCSRDVATRPRPNAPSLDSCPRLVLESVFPQGLRRPCSNRSYLRRHEKFLTHGAGLPFRRRPTPLLSRRCLTLHSVRPVSRSTASSLTALATTSHAPALATLPHAPVRTPRLSIHAPVSYCLTMTCPRALPSRPRPALPCLRDEDVSFGRCSRCRRDDALAFGRCSRRLYAQATLPCPHEEDLPSRRRSALVTTSCPRVD